MQAVREIGTAAAGKPLQPATPQLRLVHAAQEFEAQMMKELLKPLQESDGLGSDGLGGDDDDGDSGSNGALGEFAAESLGEALSRNGGLGIANELVRTLSRNGTGTSSEKVTGNGH
ncbi:MAG TPA: hypothetical protein VE291_04585 [Terracidiphilus sp.]|jgi:Rod binding domain-containing protein|nr:hypothetical protein [Terracidiphilus sp.]